MSMRSLPGQALHGITGFSWLIHTSIDVPLPKIRSSIVQAQYAFVIARDRFAQQPGSCFAEEKSRYEDIFHEVADFVY